MKPQDVGVGREKLDSDPGPIELEIETLVAGGRGLAREAGRVWFVKGGLPGDRVLARVTHTRERFVEAVAEACLEPAPERREPPCPIQVRCGGCPWMPLPESEQRRWKRRLVLDALERIGRLELVEPEPIGTPVRPLGYRNRMEFSVSARGGDPPTIGLHASDPDAPLVDVAACAVQSETANAVLAAVRTMLAALPVVADGECPVERVVLRRSETDGRVTVALGLTGPGDAGIEPAVRELYERNRDSIRGVVRFHHPRGRRGGTKARLLAGDGRLTERVAGFRFDLPPTSFFQVNTSAAETVLRTVLEMASPVAGGHVLDLYGGLGLYALGLVREGAPSAVVCDADLDAVRCGRRTAARHRFGQLRYVHADVRRFLADAGRGEKPRTVVANPPRTGFGRGVADGLRALRPERLIVVSCDPPTLARDLAALGSDGLYEIERIVPLDLFPQTPHVEVVVALRLRGAVRPPRPRGSSRPRGSGSRSR